MNILKQLIFLPVEWCLKLAAPLAAVISMAAQGNFITKAAAGFQSLPEAVREIIWWIQNIPEVGKIVDDYNTMTAANFNQEYGAGAVNYVMDYLNEAITYLQQVYQNLLDQPVATLTAALMVFLLLYLMARIVRFIRQEGQGSFITKFERRAGQRVFVDRRNEASGYDSNRWM